MPLLKSDRFGNVVEYGFGVSETALAKQEQQLQKTETKLEEKIESGKMTLDQQLKAEQQAAKKTGKLTEKIASFFAKLKGAPVAEGADSEEKYPSYCTDYSIDCEPETQPEEMLDEDVVPISVTPEEAKAHPMAKVLRS